MTTRINAKAIAPEAFNALVGLQQYVDESSIEKPLLQLIKVRASQINGCVFCIHKHTADAVKGGESHARLHLLNAWPRARFSRRVSARRWPSPRR
jgi:AhpD family alkylhydroperoxidase